MARNDEHEYTVTNSWAEMLDHFNVTVWPEFQTRGFDADKTKALELFLYNRMYNMLDTNLDNITEKLMILIHTIKDHD